MVLEPRPGQSLHKVRPLRIDITLLCRTVRRKLAWPIAMNREKMASFRCRYRLSVPS
jgi:hypothetical protein